jgi:RNA polymerase sigma-70 factor, ECF subfamily
MERNRSHLESRGAWDWSALRLTCLKEARRVLGRTPLAEDAAQEAAIRAWRNQVSCRTPARPGPWVATIARREALRLAAAPCTTPVDPAAVEAQPVPEPADVIEGIALRQELQALEVADRALLVGRYWHDLSYAELAQRSGMPISTVGVRLHRVRLRLRDTLLNT